VEKEKNGSVFCDSRVNRGNVALGGYTTTERWAQEKKKEKSSELKIGKKRNLGSAVLTKVRTPGGKGMKRGGYAGSYTYNGAETLHKRNGKRGKKKGRHISSHL